MTNSKILHFIIKELENSSLTWKGDKELFELIFAPTPYGNEIENKRKIVKQYILDIFKGNEEFDKSKFTKFANNIICGENENIYREEVLLFVQNELTRLDISTDLDIQKIIEDIPCKDGKVINYRSKFSYWKKEDTAIHNREIKNALEENFDFSSKLWSRGEVFMKKVLQKGIEKFIKDNTKKEINWFKKVKDDFGIDDNLTEQGSKDLKIINNMDRQEIKHYIEEHHPLSKSRSQKFILELVSILHSKGYYELLLSYVLEALDLDHKENVEIKKIQAHALGSSVIGEYKKAFDLLSTISTDDDDEIIDMQTEAISNMRRYQLSDTKIDNNQKKEIIKKLIIYYDEIFKHNDSYHYYPGINMAYIVAISSSLSFDDKFKYSINDIFLKAKKSINIDKKSLDSTTRYYANIAIIEFRLLRNSGNPIAEFERFLDMEEESISLIELERTQRQMQFFVDTVVSFGVGENAIVTNMQKAIELIDDFIDYQLNQ